MHNPTLLRWLLALLSLPATVGVIAVASNAAVSPADPHGAHHAASVMTLMTETIAPAAASIWNGAYAEKIGDNEWADMLKAAAILRATEETVASGGTLPADRAKAAAPLWADWAKKYAAQTTALQRAAEARDQHALAAAGDALLEVCGGCHIAYPAKIP
jgi:hypothetical protein